jgi:hypothetical protein
MSERPLWKCQCGWVHAEMSELEARKSLLQAQAWVAGETMKRYTSCMRCGASSSTFLPATSADVPTLSTLQPIVIQLPGNKP